MARAKGRSAIRPAAEGSAAEATATPEVALAERLARPDIVDRGIAQWRHIRPDIDSSGKAVVGRIIYLRDSLVREANAALARHGLRYAEYAVIATIRVSPPPHRMTPGQLLDTLLFTSGGLSNLLRRVERAGLIERRPDPEDGRGVLVGLTAEGHRLADEAMVTHAAVERRLLGMFDAAEEREFAALLKRMLVGNQDLV